MTRSMRKVVVLDLGGVVIDWQPQVQAALLLPEHPPELACKLIFQDFAKDSDWHKFDRGDLSAEQTANHISQRCQISASHVTEWLINIAENFKLIPDSIHWIEKIKSKGVTCYFLSNMPREFASVLKTRKDFLSLFDHGIFSGEIGVSKPDPEIYRFAEDMFGLNHQTIWHFFDDNLSNIKAAREAGWPSTHIESPRKLHESEVGSLFRQPRAVRSYVLRGGRIGSGQARAIDLLAHRFCIKFQTDPIGPHNWDENDRQKPLLVEIGFGMGQSTAEMALAMPQYRHLGIEVHAPGVGSLLAQIREREINNLRVIQHDAVEVLQWMIAAGSVYAFHLYFPDPWPKLRHHKRRLIQHETVQLIASRMTTGGYFHCATDWEPYASWMLEVLSAEASLNNVADGFCERPDWRAQTKFERRGLKLGHQVWDLLFTKKG